MICSLRNLKNWLVTTLATTRFAVMTKLKICKRLTGSLPIKKAKTEAAKPRYTPKLAIEDSVCVVLIFALVSCFFVMVAFCAWWLCQEKNTATMLSVMAIISIIMSVLGFALNVRSQSYHGHKGENK